MKMSPNNEVIFPHNERYRSMNVATAGWNRLLLAAGWPKKLLSLVTLTKLKSFCELSESIIAIFEFFI